MRIDKVRRRSECCSLLESIVYLKPKSTWSRYNRSMERVNYHTPFCPIRPNSCSVSHHDLVNILCSDFDNSSGGLSVEMKQCIEIAKAFGWDQNSNVPDPLKELNCPLLFLASAFGKTGIVKGLLRNGFNPGVVNEHGETALHAAVKHLHMYNNPMGKAFRKREDVFQRILLSLSVAYPKILAVQDKDGRTALHMAAIASLDRSGFADWNKRPALFSRFCLKAMIKRLKEFEAAAVLTRDEVLCIVKTTEHRNGDSVLHILAGDAEFGFETLKYILDLFLPGKLPDEKNYEGKSVFSIAWDVDSEKALMLFFSGPSHGLEQGKE